MQKINAKSANELLCGDVAFCVDNEVFTPEIESKVNKEKKESATAPEIQNLPEPHMNLDRKFEGGPKDFPTKNNVSGAPLETHLPIEAIREEYIAPAARPGSKVSDIQADPDAYKKAAEFMLRKQQELGATDFPGKFAVPYFLHKMQRREWVALILPHTPQETHSWVGQHGAGIRAWAMRQPQFERGNGAAPAPGTVVAPAMKINKNLHQ